MKTSPTPQPPHTYKRPLLSSINACIYSGVVLKQQQNDVKHFDLVWMCLGCAELTLGKDKLAIVFCFIGRESLGFSQKENQAHISSFTFKNVLSSLIMMAQKYISGLYFHSMIWLCCFICIFQLSLNCVWNCVFICTVGKTSLITRFMYDSFDNTYQVN